MEKMDLVPDWIPSWAAEQTELMTRESSKHSGGLGVNCAKSRRLCHPLLDPHQPSGTGFPNFLNNLIKQMFKGINLNLKVVIMAGCGMTALAGTHGREEREGFFGERGKSQSVVSLEFLARRSILYTMHEMLLANLRGQKLC